MEFDSGRHAFANANRYSDCDGNCYRNSHGYSYSYSHAYADRHGHSYGDRNGCGYSNRYSYSNGYGDCDRTTGYTYTERESKTVTYAKNYASAKSTADSDAAALVCVSRIAETIISYNQTP